MTISELYNYAKCHNLLDQSIGVVMDSYIEHISVHNDTSNNKNLIRDNNFNNKVEFSTEDVLKLFST